MSPEIYRAVIEEAHRHHLRVAAHVYYLADAKSLVNDGVDVLAHSVRDKPVDQELDFCDEAPGCLVHSHLHGRRIVLHLCRAPWVHAA